VNVGVSGIVAWPDGNLWFTESAANRIGRITTGGDITEFPLAGDGRQPTAIAVGPDGNLWFTEEGASKIGRISPTGEIAEFPVPTLTGTGAIAAGPDGSLWFTSSHRIGSISPSGRALRLSCLKPSCRLPALSLAAGRQGELWVGTNTELPVYAGGQTTQNVTQSQPGYLVKLFPQPPTIHIDPDARFVKDSVTKLRLTCVDAAGCHGVLRLSKQRAFPYGPDYSASTLILAHRHYELEEGESRRVSLRLYSRAMKLLSSHGGYLSAWATAGVAGDKALQPIVLRRGTLPHPAS
jgi:hypothetical protein